MAALKLDIWQRDPQGNESKINTKPMLMPAAKKQAIKAAGPGAQLTDDLFWTAEDGTETWLEEA